MSLVAGHDWSFGSSSAARIKRKILSQLKAFGKVYLMITVILNIAFLASFSDQTKSHPDSDVTQR